MRRERRRRSDRAADGCLEHDSRRKRKRQQRLAADD